MTRASRSTRSVRASCRVSTCGGNIAEDAGVKRIFRCGVTTQPVLLLEALLTDGPAVPDAKTSSHSRFGVSFRNNPSGYGWPLWR